MNQEPTWRWALLVQFFGASIAVLGLVGVMHTTTAKLRKCWPLIPPYLIWGFALWWTFFGQEKHLQDTFLGVSVTPVGLTVITAFINILCLGLIAHSTGGDTAIFTPLFLLVPHTSAMFLRGTPYEYCIYIIGILTVIFYMIGHCLATPIEFKESTPNITSPEKMHRRYVAWVLLSTVILTTVLAGWGPHGWLTQESAGGGASTSEKVTLAHSTE